MRQVYIIKTRKNVLITSDNTINVHRVDDDNARTIASLASSPPVVSGVAITATTVAPVVVRVDDVLLGSRDDVEVGIDGRRHPSRDVLLRNGG